MTDLAVTLVLADSLDMTAAKPLAGEFLAARGTPLALDASAVRRIGGQCLQVLLAAQAAWAEDGQPFAITAASAEFAEGLATLGRPDLVAQAPLPVASLQD